MRASFRKRILRKPIAQSQGLHDPCTQFRAPLKQILHDAAVLHGRQVGGKPFIWELTVVYATYINAFSEVAELGGGEIGFCGFQVPGFFFAGGRPAALLGLRRVVGDFVFGAGGEVEEVGALEEVVRMIGA